MAEGPLGVGDGMKCPKCKKVDLQRRHVKNSDVILYCCPKCKGIWFRRGQMETVLSQAVKDMPVPRNAALGPRSCPDCRLSMFEFDYPGTMVHVDMCRACQGLWIDAGEAREISMVRQGKTGEPEEPTGVKGQLITLINQVLDWAMHTY